jgi:hypothetical protein
MAVNTQAVAKGLAGLPSVEEMLQPDNFDTVPAVVRSKDGKTEQQAALTEGEFVFSVPAIIALGGGDYEKGITMLEQIHNQLREESKKYIGPQGLEAAGLGE